MDDKGNRRIAYNREAQHTLDYIEVFFDVIKDEGFIFRRDPRVKRCRDKAILKRDNVRYLVPELVLLFKSKQLSEKNLLDFNAVIDSLDREALVWLTEALSLVYENAHPWLRQLLARTSVGM
ncbi:MAG: hypothetical protein JXA33_19550 [Anaerolineae bacterium]|nr:hypothetical protein [Anaerolineae bacterium]